MMKSVDRIQQLMPASTAKSYGTYLACTTAAMYYVSLLNIKAHYLSDEKGRQ